MKLKSCNIALNPVNIIQKTIPNHGNGPGGDFLQTRMVQTSEKHAATTTKDVQKGAKKGTEMNMLFYFVYSYFIGWGIEVGMYLRKCMPAVFSTSVCLHRLVVHEISVNK